MAVSSTRPRLILVHGAWVGPWEFAPIVPILEADGWEVDAITLPSVGSTEGLSADAAAVTAAIERAGGPVVLVAHSYGGIPVTQAGGHPSVERIVYVTAFAADAGGEPSRRHGWYPAGVVGCRGRTGDDGSHPRRAGGDDRRRHAAWSSA